MNSVQQPTAEEIKAEAKKKQQEVRDRFEFALGISADNFNSLDDLSRTLDKFISSYIPF